MIFPRPFTFQSKASWNSSEALCVVGLCRDCLQQIMNARSVIWLLLRLSDRSARPCAGHTPGSGCVVLLAVQLFAMEIQPATQVPFTFRKVTSFLWGCFKMKRVQNLVENKKKKKCRRLFWREFLFTLVFFVFLLVYVQSFPSLWSGCGFRVKWNVLLRQKKSTCSLSKLKSAQSRPNVKKKKKKASNTWCTDRSQDIRGLFWLQPRGRSVHKLQGHLLRERSCFSGTSCVLSRWFDVDTPPVRVHYGL